MTVPAIREREKSMEDLFNKRQKEIILLTDFVTQQSNLLYRQDCSHYWVMAFNFITSIFLPRLKHNMRTHSD
jgi:hypothetical protein